MLTPFDLYKIQCDGLMDSAEIHQQKVNSARNDMKSLVEKGYRPDFYLDDVLHHQNLSYGSLSQREIDFILGKI